MNILFCLIVVFLNKSCDCARILCVFPSPFYSHQSFFRPIWQELGARGHELTVITTNPVRGLALQNVEQIDISFTYKLVFEDNRMQHVLNTEKNIFVLLKHMYVVMTNITVEQFASEPVRAWLRRPGRYDLLLVEAHIPAWFALAAKFDCPLIPITSMEPHSFWQLALGNADHPILNPSLNLPYRGALSLRERLAAVLIRYVELLHTVYLTYPQQQRIAAQHLNTSVDLLGAARGASLLFANVIPGFNGVLTRVPAIVELSGLLIKPARPLPGELQQFLDGAAHGAIYFSLGSNVKSSLIGSATIKTILAVFEVLPFRVIWKFEGELDGVPANVRITKWAPQQDILRHNNTKLFITQGGIQSIEEAIYYNVPMLGVPFFGDQLHNVKSIQQLEIGDGFDFGTLTAEAWREAILKIINNEKYTRNLGHISDLLIGQPSKSVDKAVRWIEYVIKHKEVDHLKGPISRAYFHQYYLLDVLLFVILLTSLVVYLIVKLAHSCVRQLFIIKRKFV